MVWERRDAGGIKSFDGLWTGGYAVRWAHLIHFWSPQWRFQEAKLSITELFNLLINPTNAAYTLVWHRDDVKPTATPQEEIAALQKDYHGIQWNAALYDDECLSVVPKSHLRVSTPDEKKALLGEGEMPGGIKVKLKAGETVFYNNHISTSSLIFTGSQHNMTFSPEPSWGLSCSPHRKLWSHHKAPNPSWLLWLSPIWRYLSSTKHPATRSVVYTRPQIQKLGAGKVERNGG